MTVTMSGLNPTSKMVTKTIRVRMDTAEWRWYMLARVLSMMVMVIMVKVTTVAEAIPWPV